MKSILIFCCCLFSHSLADGTYYLDENCGRTLDVDNYIRLQASRKLNLRSGLNCSVHLYAKPGNSGDFAKIHTRFLSIDLPLKNPVSGCSRVNIDLYDGKTNPALLTPKGLCGNFLYNTYSYVTVKDSYMTFKMTTDYSANIGSFDAIITNFHEVEGDGECLYDWWECGNGRCVEPSTKCNSFDNCGDNTDETYEKCKPTMYFYENCGQEIHVYDTVHLKLKRTEYGTLIPNTMCDNIVVAHGKFQGIGETIQVYAHFRSISLSQPVSGSCVSARIDVYEGLRNKQNISGSEGLCGTSLAIADYTTKTDNFMPIEFKTDMITQKGNFEITLTSFHTGDCLSGEFLCNNGQCVDATIQCDGYQNCGDNSDNDSDLCKHKGSLKPGYIVLIIGGIFLVGVLIIYSICRRCNHNRSKEEYSNITGKTSENTETATF